MNSASHVRVVALIIGFVFLVGLQGCAHTPQPSPLPESIQQQLGRIGVAARSTEEQKAFGAPGTGRLSNIGRGAGLGAAMGAGAGAQGGMFAIFAIPAGAALGLVGGAFYGAVASEPWQEPDATFRTVVAELDLNRVLPEHLAAFSRSHGYEITHMTAVSSEAAQGQSRYAAARRDGIDTVLEIQDLTVNLIPAEYIVNPHRVLMLSARVQLIRTADGTARDDRVVIDELGPALELTAWTANHASRFRQEVQQASERLAEKVVAEYFMVYRFPEQIMRGDFGSNIHLKGLAPRQPAEMARTPTIWSKYDKDIQEKYSYKGFLSPNPNYLPVPLEFLVMAQRSDSSRPMLSWEPFPGTDVTYDIRIWEAGSLGPETVVYDRANIDQASHRVEVPLKPSTLYYWTVRAHFSLNGKDRVTEWSRRAVRYSLFPKVMSAG